MNVHDFTTNGFRVFGKSGSRLTAEPEMWLCKSARLCGIPTRPEGRMICCVAVMQSEATEKLEALQCCSIIMSLKEAVKNCVPDKSKERE